MAKNWRILLNTFGSFGDIHPYMAIAMELHSRGHSPIIATSALYEEKIRSVGLEFIAIRPNLPPPQDQDSDLINRIMDPRHGPRFLIEEIISSAIRESYEDLVRAVDGADLLVTHPAGPAGPLVGRKTGIRWISTVLAPMSFFSAYDPPVPPYWPWLAYISLLGPRVTKFVFGAIKKSFRSEAIHNLRREIGVDYYGPPMFEGQHSPHLVLALFSQLFAQPKPDWPPQARVTGFAFYDGSRELEMPAELERFLNDGPPPIVFTLGSSAVWVARDFFHECITATRLLNRRAVLLIGDDRNRPADLGPDIVAVDYAPYQQLLPRACAMVHHGGIGTTSHGLRAGIPTLIVPFAFDQADNAAHAALLGTSRTLARSRYNSHRVATELDTLLRVPSYPTQAEAVAAKLHEENGTVRACDEIETYLDRASIAERQQEPAYAVGN